MYISSLVPQDNVLGQDPAILSYCIVLCGSGGGGPDVTFPYVSTLATHAIRLGHADIVTSCCILQAVNASINIDSLKTPHVEGEHNSHAR